MLECKLRNTYEESKLWGGASSGCPLTTEFWSPEARTHAAREAPGWVAALHAGGSHAALSARGVGAAPALLALRSGVRRRVRSRSAPSGVRWSGSAGALLGTWHPGQLTPGVAAPLPH